MMVIIVQRKRRDKTRECGDRLRRHGGHGRWLVCGEPFDSDDDVDIDDKLIIDPDPALPTTYTLHYPLKFSSR
jgi:hypothetical protein